ncbi:MAG: DUF5057 domain-containing protein [Clostridium sp.]|nr:DUF5057 domain-containing protein [Clostridium sp.]
MSKKKLFIITSVLAVMIITASVISYSIATPGNGAKDNNEISSDVSRRGAAVATDYTSNIDLIIEASNASPAEAMNIVEILPMSNPTSTISGYVSSGMFKRYVIDENSEKTPKGVMAANMINVDTVSVGPGTSLDDSVSSSVAGVENLRDLFESADLIYVSSPGYTAYDGGSNMSEEVLNYLKTYATANSKPIIMDFVTKNDSGNVVTSKKVSDLIEVIQNNHIRFRTFLWGKLNKTTNTYTRSASAESFFTRQDSYYLSYDVSLKAANGKVLIVTNGDGSSGMGGAMRGNSDADIINWAYYGNGKPSELSYEVISPAALTTAKLDEHYDFILLENDIMATTISADIYSKLKTLSESSAYILYDYDLSSGSGGGGGIEQGANNYLQLMDLLISNSGVARYSNVFAASYGFFNSLQEAGESGITSAKGIADIINSGDYRGNGTSGKGGKKFRVLELQPCYPIDLQVAESEPNISEARITDFGLKGNYYTKPSEVLRGVTSDEVEEGTEYYAFELSKAKIVYASQQYAEKYSTTALTMNQIEIDQMSTEEFISRKEVVLETYDLVYIGGNNSALKPFSMSSLLLNGTKDTTSSLNDVFTSFDMYTHTGQLQFYRVSATHNTNVTGDMSKPYGYVAGSDNKQGTMAELNGNDLTKKKLDELLEYMNAGMPIIFEKKVTDAFIETYNVKDDRFAQLCLKNIDPDSFMYDLLEAAYTNREAPGAAINWGLDATSDAALAKADNLQKDYGNTLSDEVTVFEQKTGESLVKTYKNAPVNRPSLVLTSCPKDYVEGSKSCYNEGTLSVTAYAKPAGDDVSKPVTLQLFIDQNGNSEFTDANELADTKTYTYSEDADGVAKTTTLTYNDMDEDFYGLISWKVVANIEGTKACTVSTGYAYYPRKEDVDKKEVRILQLMPVYGDRTLVTDENVQKGEVVGTYRLTDNHSGNTNYGENDGHSLYFCKECQMVKAPAFYNIIDGGSLSQNTTGFYAETSGVNVGLHEHVFGIPKYDSGVGEEDWESNLADVLADDYDFDLTIMTLDEFEDAVTYAQGNDEDTAEAYEQMAENLLSSDGSGAGEIYGKLQELTAEEDVLKEELRKMIGNNSFRMTTESYINEIIGYEKDGVPVEGSGDYYKFFMYNNAFSNGTNVPQSLKDAYNAYIAKYDEVVKLRQQYRYYMRRSGTGETWLNANYDMIVLGFAEDFGGKDLSATACEQLKTYVDKGGSMLNTHDSTTKYANAGAVNLTDNLRSLFGMDRFHVVEESTATYVAANNYLVYVNGGREVKVTVSDTDITLDVAGKEWSTDLKSQTNGTTHTDISEKVQLTVVSDQPDGTPVALYTANDWGGQGNQVAQTTVQNGQAVFELTQTAADASDIRYRKFSTADSSLYFWTQRSTTTNIYEWQQSIRTKTGWQSYTNLGVNSPVGVTDSALLFNTSQLNSSPYKYVEYDFEDAIHWNQGYKLAWDSSSGGKACYGTNGASQVNKGIVTVYPFTISTELRITGTHAQTYALDMEDKDVAVWYTLSAGSTLSTKKGGSLFAASPHDGMDSYFLYSKGTVYYCGAGHSVVTGPERDNNDERRLFINVIVNSVRNAASKPRITVHEPDTDGEEITKNKKEGNIFLDNEGKYYYNVNEKDEIPQFDFKVKVNSQTTLKEVYVYYDLNYGTEGGDYLNDYSNDKYHVMIAQYNTTADDSKNLAAGALAKLRLELNDDGTVKDGGYKNLKLKPEYFESYGNYTYIVIKAVDGKGKVAYQRIKIKLIPTLWDLTLNDTDIEINIVDMSDRVKYQV